jgi:hypothetical protein
VERKKAELPSAAFLTFDFTLLREKKVKCFFTLCVLSGFP